jgi:hypothetical protein
VLLTLVAGCIRGKLPARQFYRITVVDSIASTLRPPSSPPLAGSIAIAWYKTPGIYGSGSVIYRVGSSSYGAYPSREWAIPLGEMLGSLTEDIVRRGGLTSGPVLFETALPRRDQYEWRGAVVEFDEVDTPTSVSASVSLVAQLVRVADDSVIWAGSAEYVEPVLETQRMESVVAALSVAATRAVMRLSDEAAASLRGMTASGARTR